MPTINNVREFVVNALKQYHAIHTEAENTAIAELLSSYVTYDYVGSTYVAQVEGKGLSTEDFTTAYMTKLDAIEAGAQVNVNADWNAESGDAQILNKPNIVALFGYAYYDSSNHRISFSYSSGSSELYNIDCSSFIVDGMVDNVAIQDHTGDDIAAHGASYLLIDFNTASGKTDIKIDLQDIFNPNNYYTKSEVDSALYSYEGRIEPLETAYTYFTSAYEFLSSYVTSSYAYLEGVIADNEEVTATALNDLNDRIIAINSYGYITAAALENIDMSAKEDLANKVTDLSDSNNISNTYYASTSAIASYVASTYNTLFTYSSNAYTYLSGAYTYVLGKITDYDQAYSYLSNAYTYLSDGYTYTLGKIADYDQAYTYFSNAYTYTLSKINNLSELTTEELNTIFGIS